MGSTSILQTLLSELEHRHIRLWAEGERLRFAAPERELTPALRAQLQARKSELLEWLRRDPRNAHRPEARICRPSFAQHRFWTLQQINPTDSFYNVPFAFQLCGELDSEALRQSFNAIVRRHESLRTTLQKRDGALLQVIAPDGEINLTVEDVRNLGSAARHGGLNTIRTEMQRPFDLARESGLRAILVRVDDREYTLLLCLHNTLYDQASLLVLLKELSLHYSAFVADASVLLAPPTQYAEYAQWQEISRQARAEERLDYWRDWFSRGEPPAWDWILPDPAPSGTSFRTHVSWQRFS
ncbi:MAG TPA: condensation domain-containing protein, partial [Bryobacteraceae bacterium]|nr:condensation domain-containing protein [Bryobacteraceae bacterium]